MAKASSNLALLESGDHKIDIEHRARKMELFKDEAALNTARGHELRELLKRGYDIKTTVEMGNEIIKR